MYWFGEGGTGDPEKGDRPLLYRSKQAENERVILDEDMRQKLIISLIERLL
jgi:hypothetical protein